MKIEHLGPATDLEVIDRLLRLEGMFIVDVGCNDGALTRNLATRGAQVHGLEPNPIQAAANRQAEPVNNVTFHEAPAQAMPFEDGSADGVFFSRSLHHVPEPQMDQALREAMRILKPGSGFLYILEPEMGGQFSQLLKPFHDETQVRLAALAALKRTVDPCFEDHTEYWFTQVAHYTDLEELRDRMLANTFNSFKAEDVEQPVVRALFEAGKTAAGYSFSNPMRIQVYRSLKS